MLNLTAFQPSLAPPEIAELMRLLGEIDEFKGRWRRLGEIRAERLASLRQVTTIESAGSSTRIEGAQLGDEEVARENLLKQLHKILLEHVEKDERHRGEYKKLDNHVEARYADGRVETIFRTASPSDTPQLMADLIAATNEALAGEGAHPLVAIARFLVEFLAIHPFQDGNGRLSRALTALLMLEAGYEYVPYASVERVIEENKVQYYHALRTSQLAIQSDPARFGAWLLFFPRVLRTHERALEGKLEVERSILRLTDTQVAVLEHVERHGRATTSGTAAQLKIAPRAARYHSGLLTSKGILEAHGERKGRYYTRRLGSPSEAATRQPGAAASPRAGANSRSSTSSPRGSRARMRRRRRRPAHGMGPKPVRPASRFE